MRSVADGKGGSDARALAKEDSGKVLRSKRLICHRRGLRGPVLSGPWIRSLSIKEPVY